MKRIIVTFKIDIMTYTKTRSGNVSTHFLWTPSFFIHTPKKSEKANRDDQDVNSELMFLIFIILGACNSGVTTTAVCVQCVHLHVDLQMFRDQQKHTRKLLQYIIYGYIMETRVQTVRLTERSSANPSQRRRSQANVARYVRRCFENNCKSNEIT